MMRRYLRIHPGDMFHLEGELHEFKRCLPSGNGAISEPDLYRFENMMGRERTLDQRAFDELYVEGKIQRLVPHQHPHDRAIESFEHLDGDPQRGKRRIRQHLLKAFDAAPVSKSDAALNIFIKEVMATAPSVLLDVKSRYPLGFYLGFEPPSLYAAMACIRHAVVPKCDFATRFPGIQGEWVAYGIPDTILVDRGWEFVGMSFIDACEDAGISVEWAPARTPQYKGAGERLFRTLNTLLFHKCRGGVPLKAHQMKDAEFDPESDAMLVADLECASLRTGVYGLPLHHCLFGVSFHPRVWAAAIAAIRAGDIKPVAKSTPPEILRRMRFRPSDFSRFRAVAPADTVPKDAVTATVAAQLLAVSPVFISELIEARLLEAEEKPGGFRIPLTTLATFQAKYVASLEAHAAIGGPCHTLRQTVERLGVPRVAVPGGQLLLKRSDFDARIWKLDLGRRSPQLDTTGMTATAASGAPLKANFLAREHQDA